MTKELLTLAIAMTPIGELRVAIPIAIAVYHLPPLSAFFWAFLGNLIPGVFLLWVLEPLTRYLDDHFYVLNRFFAWLFERTRRKHSHKFEYWGALALIGFVAIPLPMTGVWSGAVAAFVFGIPFKKALFCLTVGAFIAGVIVTLATLGVLKI